MVKRRVYWWDLASLHGRTEFAVPTILKSDTQDLLQTLLPSRAARWLAVLGLWTLVSFLSASHWSAFPPADYPYTWWQLYRGKSLLWYAWGLLTPVILHLGWRYRIERPLVWRRVAWLVLLSLVVTMAYLLIYTQLVLSNITLQFSSAGYRQMLQFVLSRHSTFYFLAFWTTIGLEHAVAYHRRFNERQLRTSQLETMLAQAQLTAIRARLQPHFLFNAMHSVVALIRTDRTREAAAMLTAISELLRAALAHLDRNEVTLREELALLRQYIAVEKIRFSDRLEIYEDWPDDLLDATVPSFLLQPLVENAIRHGIEKNTGAGRISLSGVREGDRVQLEITNTGGAWSDKDPVSYGTGLTATRERLAAMYPDAFELTLQAAPGGGAVTRVAIPYVVATGADHA